MQLSRFEQKNRRPNLFMIWKLFHGTHLLVTTVRIQRRYYSEVSTVLQRSKICTQPFIITQGLQNQSTDTQNSFRLYINWLHRKIHVQAHRHCFEVSTRASHEIIACISNNKLFHVMKHHLPIGSSSPYIVSKMCCVLSTAKQELSKRVCISAPTAINDLLSFSMNCTSWGTWRKLPFLYAVVKHSAA